LAKGSSFVKNIKVSRIYLNKAFEILYTVAMKNLYDESSKKIMENADLASGFGSNRIEQVRDFAKAAGIKKIGIAHCITFSSEAELVKQFLSKDFDVTSIDCKYGKLRASDLFDGGGNKVLCNPAGQAEYLSKEKTELNLAIGLCVGHDMVFFAQSEAPVTTFITKDFSTGHSSTQTLSDVAQKLS
jgi:uncharacterized metal-binding protein